MSLEKGIIRIGTVLGIGSGIILGSYISISILPWLFEQNRWTGNKYSTTSILLIAVLLGITAFAVTILVFKGIVRIINWVIKGFKE